MRVNRKSPMYVTVNLVSYLVTERPGYYKAALNGALGWVSVWASTPHELGARIARALRGQQ